MNPALRLLVEKWIAECDKYGLVVGIKDSPELVNHILLHIDGVTDFDSPQWKQAVEIGNRLGLEIKSETIFYVGNCDLKTWNVKATFKVKEKDCENASK